MAPDLNNIPVRDADKTRVYSADETRTRAADETSVIAQSSSERDVSIGNTLAYERAQKPGLFDGLSLAQIIAGAAAAAHKRFGAVKTLDWAGFACPVHPNHGVPAKVPLLRGSPEG